MAARRKPRRIHRIAVAAILLRLWQAGIPPLKSVFAAIAHLKVHPAAAIGFRHYRRRLLPSRACRALRAPFPQPVHRGGSLFDPAQNGGRAVSQQAPESAQVAALQIPGGARRFQRLPRVMVSPVSPARRVVALTIAAAVSLATVGEPVLTHPVGTALRATNFRTLNSAPGHHSAYSNPAGADYKTIVQLCKECFLCIATASFSGSHSPHCRHRATAWGSCRTAQPLRSPNTPRSGRNCPEFEDPTGSLAARIRKPLDVS